MRLLGPATEVGALVAGAERAGRQVYLVTGGVDKHSALVAFAEGLGLPDWFGHNLDALADAVRELGDEGRQVSLVWDGVAQMRRIDPRSYAAIREVLGEVEAQRPELEVCVVLR